MHDSNVCDACLPLEGQDTFSKVYLGDRASLFDGRLHAISSENRSSPLLRPVIQGESKIMAGFILEMIYFTSWASPGGQGLSGDGRGKVL